MFWGHVLLPRRLRMVLKTHPSCLVPAGGRKTCRGLAQKKYGRLRLYFTKFWLRGEVEGRSPVLGISM